MKKARDGDTACPVTLGEDDDDQHPRAAEPDDDHRRGISQRFGEKFGKAGQFAAELLYDMYSGEYGTVPKSLAETSAPSVELHKVDGDALGEMGAKLREFMRLATP